MDNCISCPVCNGTGYVELIPDPEPVTLPEWVVAEEPEEPDFLASYMSDFNEAGS